MLQSTGWSNPLILEFLMRTTVSIAILAALVFAPFSAICATPGYEVPTYDVKITLKNRDDKKEEIVLKATVIAENPEKLSSPIAQRPFVTRFTDSTAKKPIIQIIKFGAVAEVNITETATDALAVDATVEINDVTDVKSKKYPGTEELVQTVRVGTAKTRLLESIAPNEKLNSTLSIGGRTYDVTVSVVRK
jgi:hypothetical protein